MIEQNKDKNPTDSEINSPPDDLPDLDEAKTDQKPDSSEDASKKSEKGTLNSAPKSSDNRNDASTAAPASENANSMDKPVGADIEAEQDLAAEGEAQSKNKTPELEISPADKDTRAEPEMDQRDDAGESAEPEGQDQTRSQTEISVDDHTSAEAEADEDATAENKNDNENQGLQSEDNSAQDGTNTMPESGQSAKNQNPDTKTKDPRASVAAEPAADGLSTEKDSDVLVENKESRSSEEDSADKGNTDSPTDEDPDASSETAVSGSSIKEETAGSAEEKQNDILDETPENDPSEPKPNNPEAAAEDLPELEPRKKVPLAKVSLAAFLVVAVFSGFFIFDNKPSIKPAEKATTREASKTLSAKTGEKNRKPAIQPDDPNYIYYAKIEELTTLRDTLLHKNKEILELKNHYQSGIEELEKEILDELRYPGDVTFLQATDNKRIEFALRTIQRRLAYIGRLDRPAEWAFQAAEDLLYIKRKALMDIQVAEVASGIDMNMHVRHMNTALKKYRPTADKLAVDMTDAQSQTLESIWLGIQNKNLAHSSQRVRSKNQIIFEQICTGNFSRLTELSEISVDSAKCIGEMQGSDLFLNGLTEISPRAARNLFQWEGNWICLNGFRAISPRVAAYLFEWEGRWISLNGLTEFPPEIGNLLLQWGGNQLELMGLRYTDGSAAKIGIKYLAQWERSGGKLFVPRTIRKKIDDINGHQGPSA